jgi:H/ACA ribonucleoprotein complex non-core subunit NAF1
MRARRAGSRTGSVTSSRHTTPIPSQMRDQDLTEQFLDPNPYAEHGAYDFDYAASGRSRPPPIPYDDPYADGYNADTMIPSLPQASPVLHERQEQRDETSAGLDRRQHPYRRNSTARARGQRGGARGRGRGRERADRGRERSVQRRSSAPSPNRYAVINVPQHDEPYDPRSPQPLSPSPIAVATATGEYSGGSMATPSPTTTQHSISSAWSFPHQQNYNFNSPGYQHPYVQPHINPRFASAFGIDVGYLQQAQMVTPSYGQNAYEGLDTEQRPSQENWLEEWTVYGSQQDVPGSGSSV